MPFIQNASDSQYYRLEGIIILMPGAIYWVTQDVYDNNAAIAAALLAGEIIDYTGIGTPIPNNIPSQEIIVAKSGGNFTVLSSAVASITDATATKPYNIRLYPGVFETAEITLPDYVSLTGLDPKSCILKSTTANTDYVIQAGDHSYIGNIGIDNSTDISSEADPKCIYINGKTVFITNCILDLTPTYTSGGANWSRGIDIAGASTVYIRDTKITVTSPVGFDSRQGIFISHASSILYVYGCDINITTGSLASYGIDLDLVDQAYIYNSRIVSAGFGIITAAATTMIEVEYCTIESTANNAPAATITTSNNKYYGCTLKSHGSSPDCFTTSGQYNCRIAHCRMNRAAPIHAFLTNLIDTPNNISDTDI
jgi:hypothetical protein